VELRTYLAGQIARAITIFNVDEVVVFSEDAKEVVDLEFKGARKSDPNLFLARVLQYLECPQYLRKQLFELHPDLRYAGLLNPLDSPHHLNRDSDSNYREGVVVARKSTNEKTCFVDIGKRRWCELDKKLEAGTRVTVKLKKKDLNTIKIEGTPVSPTRPRERNKFTNWGYTVRIAKGIEEVLTGCPYKAGYDLTIGTSERGRDATDKSFKLRKFNHLLVVFGGVKGLENCLIKSGDDDEAQKLEEPEKMFDHYINTCVLQGSGTIRTEEAILVSLSVLWPHIRANPRY